MRLDLQRLLIEGDALIIFALLKINSASVQIPEGIGGFELDDAPKGRKCFIVFS